MSIKICIFNHKGGVCKTTTAFNLAWMLATTYQKKVLLVDADSQCNLTNMVLTDDNFENYYEENPKDNIKDCLAPAFEGKATLIEAANCYKNPRVPNMFLIPGSFDLTEYDVSLGLALSASITSLQSLPGSFERLFSETSTKYGTDYTIIDMSPSLSAINRVLLLGCDYFLIPATPDTFSIMAIRSLARLLPRWESNGKIYRQLFEQAIYPFPKRTPRFLGTVIQRYSIKGGRRNTAERPPSSANQNLIQSINTTVTDALVPELTKVEMTFPANQYSEDHCLALIQDFHSLNACYHRFGTPVFALSDEQLKKINHIGNLAVSDRTIINEVKNSVESLTKKILELTTPVEKKSKKNKQSK